VAIRDSDIEDDVDDHPRVAHLRDHRKIDLRNSFREVVVSQILTEQLLAGEIGLTHAVGAGQSHTGDDGVKAGPLGNTRLSHPIPVQLGLLDLLPDFYGQITIPQ
jgi:hypothetical protein